MGQIVGSYWTDPSGDAYTGFVDDAEGGDPGDAANFRTVVAPESPITQPLGINNDGLIAGNAEIGGPDSLQSGFLLDAGEFISVILPASYESNVFGLNDDVQVVGSSFAGCSEDGCPYINGFILDTQH
jgi:hypothetical protein